MQLTRRQLLTLGLGAALATRHILAAPLPATAPAPASTAAADPLSQLATQLETRLAGRIGIALYDTHTGRRLAWRGDERFPLCSTFKLLAVGQVLSRVDAGRDFLDRRIRISADDLASHSPVTRLHVGSSMTLADLCVAALTQSDNTAGNLLLRTLGGPGGLTRFLRKLGDRATRLDRWETALNEAAPGDVRDTTTPSAMAGSMHALLLGKRLTPLSRTRLTDWLMASKTGGTKLRAGLPADWAIGDKTGGGNHGSSNDVAIIWPPHRKPAIVCVYLTGTGADAAARDRAIAEVGTLLPKLLA